MTTNTPGAWFTLNASYYAATVCDPAQLLDDANVLLKGAASINHCLSDLLLQAKDVVFQDLASALRASATLAEMGRGSVEQAQLRLEELRQRCV